MVPAWVLKTITSGAKVIWDICTTMDLESKRFKQAFVCYEIAAKKNLKIAQTRVADMYFSGEGVKKKTCIKHLNGIRRQLIRATPWLNIIWEYVMKKATVQKLILIRP